MFCEDFVDSELGCFSADVLGTKHLDLYSD